MDFRKLRIGDFFIVKEKYAVVIAATFIEEEAKLAAIEKSKEFFIKEFCGKKIQINGSNYSISTNITGIQVSSSISEFKDIFFITDLSDVGKMQINDLVKVVD